MTRLERRIANLTKKERAAMHYERFVLHECPSGIDCGETCMDVSACVKCWGAEYEKE